MYTTNCDGHPESLQDLCVYYSDLSLQLATERKIEIFRAKNKIRIGFWNIQIMYETRKSAQVTMQMR